MPISIETYLVNIDVIHLDKSKRRKIDEDHVESLMDSIQKHDLIHSILLDEKNNLIAGAHRLSAFRKLRDAKIPCPFPDYENWNRILIRYANNSTASELEEIELIENLKHAKLFWTDEALGIHRIHTRQSRLDPTWTTERTAELLGWSSKTVFRACIAAPEIMAKNEAVLAAGNITTAFNLCQRIAERKRTAQLEEIAAPIENRAKKAPVITSADIISPMLTALDGVETPHEAPQKTSASIPTQSPILNESFHNFKPFGHYYNFLHCDFPYGIDIDKSTNRNRDKTHILYKDSEQIYFNLLETLSEFANSYVSDSAHIMFWFSQKHLAKTKEFFADKMPEWHVQDFLMIWHFGGRGTGILPDPKRYGRRNYETAMLLTRGDRKIVKPKDLLVSIQKNSETRIHAAEKPVPMLRHFMEMFVDETTRFLDPTCGSGTSLRVAHALNARSVCGLEIDATVSKAASTEFFRSLKSRQTFGSMGFPS